MTISYAQPNPVPIPNPTDGIDRGHLSKDNLPAELSFVILTIHLCNGLNDKNLVKPRKNVFSYSLTVSCVT